MKTLFATLIIQLYMQNETLTPRSNLLGKGSYFDFMLFIGDFSGPSRL